MTKKLTENQHILCNQIAIMTALQLIMANNKETMIVSWQFRQLTDRIKDTQKAAND